MANLVDINEVVCSNAGVDELYINHLANLDLAAMTFTNRTVTSWVILNSLPFKQIKFNKLLGNYSSAKAADSNVNEATITVQLRGKDPDTINAINELQFGCKPLVAVMRHAGETHYRVFGLDIKRGDTVLTGDILETCKIGYTDGSGVVTDLESATEVTFRFKLFKQTLLFANIKPTV